VIIRDVNLLLYAVLPESPFHPRAQAWWEQVVNESNPIGLTDTTIFGFLRTATNPRITERPLGVNEALAFVRDWLSQPNIEVLVPGSNYIRIALRLLEQTGTAGNLTTDARLATYAIENKADVYSNDIDFARFPDVTWINPLR
jgi:toxin-antitoxin system PIN domain toxin